MASHRAIQWAHVPTHITDPFDRVAEYCAQLVSSEPITENVRVQGSISLAQCRMTLRSAYDMYNQAIYSHQTHRDQALSARLARLNRDWYESHLDADITSYERADLSFDPPDLVSVDDIKALGIDLEKLAPKDLMKQRLKHEALDRGRARIHVQKTQTQWTDTKNKLLHALDACDKRDKDALELTAAALKGYPLIYNLDLDSITEEYRVAKLRASMGRDDDEPAGLDNNSPVHSPDVIDSQAMDSPRPSFHTNSNTSSPSRTVTPSDVDMADTAPHTSSPSHSSSPTRTMSMDTDNTGPNAISLSRMSPTDRGNAKAESGDLADMDTL